LPLGSYVPDFIPLTVREAPATTEKLEHHDRAAADMTGPVHTAGEQTVPPIETRKMRSFRMTAAVALAVCIGMALGLGAGWWFQGIFRARGCSHDDRNYVLYEDLLGPIGAKTKEETEIALTNPHVLLYLGLNSAGPPLGYDPIDVPVPPRHGRRLEPDRE
jgi:hypothetical protein